MEHSEKLTLQFTQQEQERRNALVEVVDLFFEWQQARDFEEKTALKFYRDEDEFLVMQKRVSLTTMQGSPMNDIDDVQKLIAWFKEDLAIPSDKKVWYIIEEDEDGESYLYPAYLPYDKYYVHDEMSEAVLEKKNAFDHRTLVYLKEGGYVVVPTERLKLCFKERAFCSIIITE